MKGWVRGGARAVRSIARMPWRDRWELARVAAVVVLVEAGLRLTTLPRLARLLGVRVTFDQEPPDTPLPNALPPWASRRLDVVRAVLRSGPSGATCLRVSLVGAQRLRRLSPTVRLGVRRDDGTFQAHAWLEIGGRPVDPAASSFSPMVRIER